MNAFTYPSQNTWSSLSFRGLALCINCLIVYLTRALRNLTLNIKMEEKGVHMLLKTLILNDISLSLISFLQCDDD